MEELAYNLGGNFAEVVPRWFTRSYESAVVTSKSEKYLEDAEGTCSDLLTDLSIRMDEEDKPSNNIDFYCSRERDELGASEDLDMIAINPNEAYRRGLSIGKIEEIGRKVFKNYSTAVQLLSESQAKKDRDEDGEEDVFIEGLGDAFMDAFTERYINKYDFLEGEGKRRSAWSSRKKSGDYDENLYKYVRDNLGGICDELDRLEREEDLDVTPEDERIVLKRVRKEIPDKLLEGEAASDKEEVIEGKPYGLIGGSGESNYHELHIGEKAEEIMPPGMLEELLDGADIYEKDGKISFKEIYESKEGKKVTFSIEVEVEGEEEESTGANPRSDEETMFEPVHDPMSLDPTEERRKAKT